MTEGKQYQVVVIIPALNPGEALLDYVAELEARGIPRFIIIDDGSAAEKAPIFAQLAARASCTVLHHARNQGKGQALKTAIHHYLEHYTGQYQGVITADADGQHAAADICRIAGHLLGDMQQIILGQRDFSAADVPTRSKIGNAVTSHLFHWLYGVYYRDTQTGLRGIPDCLLSWAVSLRGKRFEFELVMLIEARKNGYQVLEIPINTIYPTGKRHFSHYSTVRDSLPVAAALISGLVEYIAAAAASGVLDLGIFLLLNRYLSSAIPMEWRILICQGSARVFSSILNYSLNRKLVFSKQRRKRSSVPRYYLIWLSQLVASTALIYWLQSLISIHLGWVKIIVDGLLAIFSYQVQLHWVFAKPKDLD